MATRAKDTKIDSGFVHCGLWHVTLSCGGKDTGQQGEPLFIAGDSLAEMEAVFAKWNDMGYEIKSATRVGRIVAWKSWRITGTLD